MPLQRQGAETGIRVPTFTYLLEPFTPPTSPIHNTSPDILQIQNLKQRVKVAEAKAKECMKRARAAEQKSKADRMELVNTKQVCDGLRSYRRGYEPLQRE